MPYKLVPRLLRTNILSIQFVRSEVDPTGVLTGPVYRVEMTVNGDPCSFDLQLVHTTGFALLDGPDVFGNLKYPARAIAAIVRRFHEGEAFTFPIDLGDIGKV